jgi:RimJ/RimL family protein N-acetyltransferase
LTAQGQPGVTVALRAANAADSARLLEWRNDPDAVTFSVSRRRVDPAEHARWLASRLAEPEPRLWIAEEDGVPVGQVRVDVRDGVGTVSVAVAPDNRGRGLGSAMLGAMVAQVAGDGAISVLQALVRPDNAASLRAFEKVGFRVQEPGGHGLMILRRPGRQRDAGA